ncbi:hypothetical protein [Methylobacterium sp. CM6247]
MSALRPGTARGDIAVYDGRTPIGFIRGSTAGVYAYDSEGRPVGTFADRKAAQSALSARAAGKAVSP